MEILADISEPQVPQNEQKEQKDQQIEFSFCLFRFQWEKLLFFSF